MRKKIQRIGALLLAGVMVLGCVAPLIARAKEPMRGAWISTVYNADYPTAIHDEEAQKAEFSEKLDKLQAIGINAVFVQVRPKGDALYESALNPWSAVLTGTQGQDPNYDPMAYMIQEAHKRGMEFHAWLNPYRVTTSGVDFQALSADNMARKNPNWVIAYNNALYYDPSNEDVKQYICDTVAEIVRNYEVDGIHFDDYFYPSNYPLSEGETAEGAEANQRRAHINDMIERVGKTIEDIDGSVSYGVSPMGIWKNNTIDPSGSATKGTEGYHAVFADAKAWIDGGWIDYIAPQIYWEQGNAYADYETLVKWWSNVTNGTGVDLYIGQAVYKDVVAEEIVEQMQINDRYNADGSIFFSSRDLLSNRKNAATALRMHWGTTAQTPSETPDVPETPETPIAKPETPITKPTGENKLAYVTKSRILINGQSVAVDIYIIDDYSYFRLRDIASAINGTEKQFQTVWDEETQSIQLKTGMPYEGSGIVAGGATQNAIATTSTAGLYVDSQKSEVSAYTIHDYTYYKLRDLAQVLNFAVTWDEATATIGVDTSQSY